jgi:acyl-CoA hydrolase
VKVLSEVPSTGEVKHACTAYLTFVHLGSDPSAPLRPQPCPPFTPETPAEQRRFTLALERRARRMERVKSLEQLSLSA